MLEAAISQPTPDDSSSATDRPRAQIDVRTIPLPSLTKDDLARWNRLAARSSEPNPFLVPAFVQPLVRLLHASKSISILAVEDRQTGDWKAAGIFESTLPSLRQPLIYGQAISSPYTFLDGILVDPDGDADSVLKLFQSESERGRWHGFRFRAVRSNSRLMRWLDHAADRTRAGIVASPEWTRAQYVTDKPTDAEQLLARCSKARRKSLRRARRRLDAFGSIDFRIVHAKSGDDPCVQAFLRLEQMGWKGRRGSAIASHPEHATFFRAMIDGFARQQSALFGELRCNGRPIASSCNLRSGELLSAFKIGWDPAFACASVGMWSEIELVAAVSKQFPGIHRIDSCADAGSHLESVWQDRQRMQSVAYSWSRIGQAIQTAGNMARLIRNRMAGFAHA